MVRLFISMFCGLAIPALLVSAYSRWNNGCRRELPHWRDGVGLASVAFIFASWSIQLVGLVLLLTHINLQGSQNFAWYWMHIEIYLLPLAPLLALGFRGLPRLQVFTAGILVWVLTATFVYI
jgi:hypothetical protein